MNLLAVCIFWFPCLAFPDSWMILLWLQSPIPPPPTPAQRGEAPPTSRISSLAPSFCFLPFSCHLCPRVQTLPSSLPSCDPSSVGQEGRCWGYKVDPFLMGPRMNYKIPRIGQSNQGSICGFLKFPASFFTQAAERP